LEKLGKPLPVMMHAIFTHHDLFDKLELPQEKVFKFFQQINDGYRASNPYHNAIHAADVAQTTNFFLTKGGLGAYIEFFFFPLFFVFYSFETLELIFEEQIIN
jgi:hypothetical protein